MNAVTAGPRPTPAPIHAADWVAAFFRTVDTKNADDIADWFADDIELHFANNPATRTKAEAREGLRQFMSTFKAMQHKAENLVLSGDSAAQQAIVTYTKNDGRDVPIPASSYLRRNGEKRLDRLWVYIDLAPLFAP